MSNRANSLDVVLKFLETAEREVVARFTEEATIKDVLYHFVERGIIEPKRLRNYMITTDFERVLRENGGHATHTFMDLSIEYGLSERQIQSIVYKQRYKNFKKNNIR